MNQSINIAKQSEFPASALDFVWFELTNRCNLQCVHCYAESGPMTGTNDILTETDYLNLIEQVYSLGCRKLQFIGGEPTLNRSLPKLIKVAFHKGFEFIEVFTNLTRLPDNILSVFCEFNVAIATSFYSYDSKTHDEITTQKGSFARTVKNMQKIMDAGLMLRAGIIEMEQNKQHISKTREFLENLGVKDIGFDRQREFGRAGSSSCSGMNELCGNCAGNILSIGADGVVAPCIMSKQWAVGSVLESSMDEIINSSKLITTRENIFNATNQSNKKYEMGGCNPDRTSPCSPDRQQCSPCYPNQHCGPNSCQPTRTPKHSALINQVMS